MGEVVNFPKAKGAEKIPAPGGEQPGFRVLDNTRQSDGSINTCVNKQPSWGVFDNPDGDTPDAAYP